MSIVYFLALVGVLVLIHELGHFTAAKFLDVRVLRLSVGYGKPLLRFRGGETEYQLCAFPLGGYVRIAGVETGEDDGGGRRSFGARPLWQRVVIILAGPLANLVVPFAVYFGFFARHTELPAAVVGDVVEESPAARAGLEPGDQILSINGQDVRYWEELENQIGGAPGRELHLRLARGNRVLERYVVPVEEQFRKRDGSSKRVGWIGITREPFLPLVGVLDPSSPAATAGIRTGDHVISADGRPISNWGDLARRLGTGGRINLVYFRGTPVPGIPQVQLLEAHFADLVAQTSLTPELKRTSYTGLERAEMFVARIEPSPAEVAGLRVGDLVTKLDGRPLHHWSDLEQQLLADPDRTWTLTWKRTDPDGKPLELSASLTQQWQNQEDEFGHTVRRLMFGARNHTQRGRAKMIEIDGRFGYAASKAVERTAETVAEMSGAFFSVLTGSQPGEALGGPLMMYRIASVSGEKGWESFLLMLALVSVNLGLLNLLPVPVLDGGHLLVFAIEGVRRRPLSERARERIQSAGLAVVLMITVLAVKNDVLRYLVSS